MCRANCVATGLGHQALSATGEASVLGWKHVGLDVHFLHRVLDRRVGADVVANVVLRRDVRHAVNQLLVVPVAAAADVRRRRVANVVDPGNQKREVEWIAALVGQLEDGIGLDRLSKTRSLRVETHLVLGVDLDGLRHRTHVKMKFTGRVSVT